MQDQRMRNRYYNTMVHSIIMLSFFQTNKRSLHDIEARINAYDNKNKEQLEELQKEVLELKSMQQLTLYIDIIIKIYSRA